MIFNSKDGITPYWFIGKVVDKDDPTNSGRIRVRAFGLHDNVSANDKTELDLIETQDLPWAFCVNGSYGAINSLPDEGDWVLGFFTDGRDAQFPIVIGSLLGMNLNDL